MDNLASEFKINIFGVTKISLLYGELLPYKDEATEQLQYLYSKKVGKVIFPTIIIRPNNIQTISKLTEFLINPNPNYLKIVNHNIYYLVLNKYLTIKYKAENNNGKLITITNKIFTAATNASYRNNPDKKLSKKHIFKLFKGAINQLSKKQSTVIILITKAKLLSITHTAKTLF